MIERDPITQTILCGVSVKFTYMTGETRPSDVQIYVDGILLDDTATERCGPITHEEDWMDLGTSEKTVLKQIFTWAKQKLDTQIDETGTLPPMPDE